MNNSSQQVEVLARGVCIRDGKILLCHTKGAENTYLPGGHVEFREEARKSLRREIREELGVDVAVGRFLGVVEHSFFQRGTRHCEINLVFEMDVRGLDPAKEPVSEEEYIEFRWVPQKRLSDSNLEPAVLRKLLPKWLKQKERVERWATSRPERT
jgi:ADP-ribose pyrophosphatase YjhB (NUDIX family)